MGMETCSKWAAGFRANEAVVNIRYATRTARVVEFAPWVVPPGYVPIVYDDDEEWTIMIPADDLTRL